MKEGGDAGRCRASRMRSPLAYTPRRGPLRDASALGGLLYFGRSRSIAFVVSNPLVLAGVGAAVVVAGLCAGAGGGAGGLGPLRRRPRRSSSLTSTRSLRSGAKRSWCAAGSFPCWGGSTSAPRRSPRERCWPARVVVVLLAFAVLSASVDPDRLLRMLRPLARRSALTAALIARLVPLAAARPCARARGGALRGPAAAPVGAAAIAAAAGGGRAGPLGRRRGDARAARLRARRAPRRAAQPRPGRRSWRFAITGVAILALGLGAVAAGVAAYDAYPRSPWIRAPRRWPSRRRFPCWRRCPSPGPAGFGRNLRPEVARG